MIENLALSFEIIFPLFALMGIGFLLRKLKILSLTSLNQMNDAAFIIFLPIQIFMTIYQSDLEQILNIRLILFIVISLPILFILSVIYVEMTEQEIAKKGVIVQALIRSNFVIMGFPIMAAMYPSNDTAICALVLAVSMPIFTPLQVIALEMYRHKSIDLLNIFKNIIKNPLILGTFFGLFYLGTAIDLNPILEKSLSDIGKLGTPIALMVLGGTLKFDWFRENIRRLLWITTLKLIIVPSMMLALALYLGFNQIEISVLMIFYAAPTAVTTYSMAVKLKGDAGLSQQIIIFTTIFSMFTLTLWISIVRMIFI